MTRWKRHKKSPGEGEQQPQPIGVAVSTEISTRPPEPLADGGANKTWLLQKQYEEVNTNFRTTWDLYIKFYTVFLTFNVAALAALFSNGFTLVEKSKWLVIGAFALQDLLCAITSGLMAKFSLRSGKQLEQARRALLQDRVEYGDGIPAASLPVGLARWAGWANLGAMLAMMALWLGAGLIKRGGP